VSAGGQKQLAASASTALQSVQGAFVYLSQPAALRTLQRVLMALVFLWVLLSLARVLWSFLPETEPLPALLVINPVSPAAPAVAAAEVDIEALLAANLFGEPGQVVPTDSEGLAEPSPQAAITEEEASVALAGIENGAPETKLPLLLRGVLASSEAGLGQAVIEHRKVQDIFQVGDEVPGGRRVVLAKVMRTQVVLDSDGKYELLTLFEESALASQISEAPGNRPSIRPSKVSGSEPVETPGEAAELAARYREQLYADPESLADVVRVTAVRENGGLRGYRISPGKAAREFSALGFRPGDLVTSVNGMSLTDPSNTVRLYQAMRAAQEAVFELERGGETLTLSVSIGTEAGVP
jgi:general secretion pathway protein C